MRQPRDSAPDEWIFPVIAIIIVAVAVSKICPRLIDKIAEAHSVTKQAHAAGK